MQGNTQTAMVSKADMTHRYTGVLTYGNGQDVYLDSFYKTEKAARNAVIRARARLHAAGIAVATIRTAGVAIQVTGWSSPIKRGLFPSDYSPTRDRYLSDYFK
jgi:hypothetical protein